MAQQQRTQRPIQDDAFGPFIGVKNCLIIEGIALAAFGLGLWLFWS